MVVAFLASSLSLVAQETGSIKGMIIDQKTLQPLPFCHVQLDYTTTGTIGLADGSFEITGVSIGKHAITITYVGYVSQTVREVQVVQDKVSYLEIELVPSAIKLDDFEIVAFKHEASDDMPVGTYSLSREEIFRSPASNGNIFKAISVIPGVQSGGGSFSALAVRGQGADDNATFVDGFPIFELSHLSGGAGAGISGGFEDPNGGRFSIFGPRVIDGLVIQTGGFSSLYGRKNSSYLNLTVKEGNPENAEIDIMASLTGPSLSYSGSLFDGSTLFASVRYQNFEPALNLTGQGELGSPSFVDLTIKSVTDLNPKNKLTVLALFNPEQFMRTPKHIAKDDLLENTLVVDASQKKGLVGFKLRTLLTDQSHITNFVYQRFKFSDLLFGRAYPEFNADGSIPNESQIPVNNRKGNLANDEQELGIRSIYSNYLNSSTTFTLGLEASRVQIDHARELFDTDTAYSFYRNELPQNQQNQNYFVLDPQFFNSSFNGDALNASLFTNVQFSPFKNLVLNAGLRYDYTGFSEEGKVSPRLSGSYHISEKTSVNASYGIYFQDPLHIYIADNDGGKLSPERSIHYIGGVKHYIRKDLKFTVEGYYRDLDELIVRDNSTINEVVNQGTGHSYGVDVSLVKRLSNKYNGQLSYSYSQTKRDNKDGLGEYDFIYSQPHLVNFLFSFQPNEKLVFSFKFRYSTGQPTNSSIIFEDVFSDPNLVRYGQELQGRNDIRNDDFFNIDLRVDRRFYLGKASLNWFAEIQNVLNRENAATRTFFERTGEYKPQALGILPTVGLRLEL